VVESSQLDFASVGINHFLAVHVPVYVTSDGYRQLEKVSENGPVSQKSEKLIGGEKHEAHDGAKKT
jgi:hypothetical protein